MRGAILAGGAASRFGGEPKGLWEVGGERILDRAVRALRTAVGSDPLIVANATKREIGRKFDFDIPFGIGILGAANMLFDFVWQLVL